MLNQTRTDVFVMFNCLKLAWGEDDDRDFAWGAFLVFYEVLVFFGDDGPETFALLGISLLSGDGNDAWSNLYFSLWVALQVEPPDGMLGCATVGGDDDVVVCIGEKEKWSVSLYTALATSCGEDEMMFPAAYFSTCETKERDMPLHKEA